MDLLVAPTRVILSVQDLDEASRFLEDELHLRCVTPQWRSPRSEWFQDLSGQLVIVRETPSAVFTQLRAGAIHTDAEPGEYPGLGTTWTVRAPLNPAGEGGLRAQSADEPAIERLVSMADAQTPWAIRSFVSLGLPEILADGPKRIAHLSAFCDVESGRLQRLLRHLAARGLLSRNGPEIYALTELGELLTSRSGSGLSEWLDYDSSATIWARNAPDLLECLRKGTPVHGDQGSFWDQIQRDSHLAASFSNLMAYRSRSSALRLSTVYNWTGVQTITDVGGGTGTTLRFLLRNHRHMKGTLLDLKEPIAEAQRQLQRRPSVEADRLTLMPGDFLTTPPPTADLLLLSRILHDWSDVEASTILKNCAASLGKGGRILLCEGLSDSGDALATTDSDLAMLTTFGGRERNVVEFDKIATDNSLAVNGAVRMSSELFAIELVPSSADEKNGPGTHHR